MRKLLVSVAAIVAVIALALAPALASAGTQTRTRVPARGSLAGFLPAAVPGEVIVKFRPGISRARTASVAGSVGAAMVAGPVSGYAVVKAAAGTSSEQLIAALGSDPSVAYAEPNLLRYLSAVPSDPRFVDQWGMNNIGQSHPTSGSAATRLGTSGADIDAVEAWDSQLGSTDTIVAIMDSGVDITHPDLADNLWVNPGEVAGNGIDDDGNGYKDDMHGWDFADNDAGLLQATGEYAGWDHGTHVAGIVGAVAGNGVGVSGVCPACKMMVLKMFKPFDTDGNGSKDSMVGDVAAELKAFDYAISMGADVINGSFGGSVVSTKAERAKIKKGIAAGITMVFAAGNENGDNDLLIPGLDFDNDEVIDSISPAYPASYDLPGILSVAASTDGDQNGFQSACFAALLSREWPCSFTNWGHESVDVSAPGVDILSTLPDSSYDTFDGTSMAAPHVAGVAGLVVSEHPDYTPAQVVNAIMNSVDTPESLQSLLAFPDTPAATGDFTVTAGRLNAAAALTGSPTDSFPTTDGNVGGARSLSTTVSDSVSWPKDVNDVFKKKLTKGARYKAVLNASGTSDLDLQIYKPRAYEIWQFDTSCFGGTGCSVLYYEPTGSGDVTTRFKAVNGGTYYFHVNAWVLNSGTYTLKVTKI